MVSRYERIKVIATDDIRQNFSSPKLLLKLILEIHHEVNYYNTSYKQAFSRLALYTPTCIISSYLMEIWQNDYFCCLGGLLNESYSSVS